MSLFSEQKSLYILIDETFYVGFGLLSIVTIYIITIIFIDCIVTKRLFNVLDFFIFPE